jgi:glycyl-tRNA synthetase beta chain
MADFLLEIGLEEVPARMIAGAEEDLRVRIRNLLTRERLITLTGSNIWDEGGLQVDGEYVIRSYSTPRRLAVYVKDVAEKQADSKEFVKGPPVSVAYKDGNPTPAAIAFAKKAGVAVEELLTTKEAKGEYISAYVPRTGRSAHEILATELPKEVLAIYWAKNMYWRAGKPERFVRPVRWVVALLDSNIVPLEIAGIAAGNASRGHRVLCGEHSVPISSVKDYAAALRAAHVIVDVAERRHIIRKALDAATRTVPGVRWREDEALVETVVHLTEWPTAILGDFEAEYLELPEEVLVTVMRDHQKYFAVEGADGKLAPHFLTVLNMQTDAEGAAIIRHGNARVLRARFKDARFFWDFDQKTPLQGRYSGLKSLTFQKELGTYLWKTTQNSMVKNQLKEVLVAREFSKFDDEALSIAVELAKTDLTTELVKEFTELQGIIGGLYALAQGFGDKVAIAIYDQYSPASTEDAIPRTSEGQLLGLADRIQTITAMFGIGNAPTGSKDPFALRRAANAIVKILAESELPLTLGDVLNASGADEANRQQVAAFLRERLHFFLKDVRGFAYDVVNAVLAAGADDVRDAIARAEALTAVRGSEDFVAVSIAFRRMRNILTQAIDKGIFDQESDAVDIRAWLNAPEELLLLLEAGKVKEIVDQLCAEGNYREAIQRIAGLRPIIDKFFDKVMIMADDPQLRQSRLDLIAMVLGNFSTIANFSEIVTP